MARIEKLRKWIMECGLNQNNLYRFSVCLDHIEKTRHKHHLDNRLDIFEMEVKKALREQTD